MAVESIQRGGKWLLRAACDQCGSKKEYGIGGKMDAKSGAVVLERNGWFALDTGRIVCPDCFGKDKPKGKPMEKRVAVREPTMVELRKIMVALEAYFVDGLYQSGYSDKKVAAELELPEAMVKKVRLEAFGQERNPELEKLKADAGDLRDRLTDLFRRISEIERQAA